MGNIANFLTRYALPVVALLLMVFAIWHVSGVSQTNLASTPQRLAAPPDNPYSETVAAAGIVEPQTENIAIGSSLPGVAVKVFVKVGQKVARGAPLFQLDDRQLQAELITRKAALTAAQAELSRLENQPRQEQLPVAEAQVAEAVARLTNEQDQLRRTRELASQNVVTNEELVRRQQATIMAEAQLARVRSEYSLLMAGAWKYDKLVAQAAVDQAAAQVKQAEIELDRLVVRAQEDGEVLQLNVRPGEFVGAPPSRGLVLLGNVQQLHVRVDIDEHDIPRYIEGSPAVASVRGRANVQYPLEFIRIEPYVIPKRSLTGDNIERVDTRVMQVIYAVTSKPEPLFVGQQVDVFIDIAAKK